MTPEPAGRKRETSSVECFCDVAIPHTRLDALTYEFEPAEVPLAAGDCVQVRLRGKKARGVVLALLAKSPFAKTSRVEKLIEARLVSAELLELLRWVNAYYLGRMGETLGLALPRGVCGYGLRRSAKKDRRPVTVEPRPVVADIAPAACDFGPGFRVHVSLGQSEELVASFAASVLGRGSVVVLAPESSASYWGRTLGLALGLEPVLYHGELKAAERKRVWREVRTGEHKLVVGVRSAAFAPVPDFAGAVVLDEHDKVFKEERHPRIHARDVAVARAKLADCPVLLCDPTPSAETWLNLKSGQYREVEVGSQGPVVRAEVANRQSSIVSRQSCTVVDMRRHRGVLFAPALVNALRETHAAGGAAVLYINRRGLSRHVTCADCGTPLSCPDCGVSFVLYSGGVLACRYCGKTTTAPRACPVCTSPVFRYKAPGIEMAVRDAAGLLPDAQVCPVTTESESPPASQSIVNRQSPILIGTRALLGVEWPERTGLVAALSVDDDLCLPDFRARERTFQVLSSLMRRADRFGARLILQTRRPDDVAVQSAVVRDTRGFLDRELEARKELRFPPFRRLVLVELHAGTEARAATRAESLCSKLGRVPGVEVLGPVPVPGRKHAVQMLVKLERRLRFDRLVRVSELESAGVRAKIDVDPLETMP